MADTFEVLAQVQLTAVDAIVYQVPAATKVYVKWVHVCNTETADVNVRLAAPAGAALAKANALWWDTPVAHNGDLDAEWNLPLTANQTIRGLASASPGLTVTITGIKEV
jgi:hypothetical protein